MTISERLFKIIEDKGITAYRLSKLTGIPSRTVFDWRKKNTNPGADKIMVICEALEITPEELLIGKPADEVPAYDHTVSADGIDMQIMRDYLELSEAKKKRLLAYMSMLQNTKEREESGDE